MNPGLHGSNGLDPKVAYKIYQCYVIPRLLYGFEVLPLNSTQQDILRKFHLNNLRRFQSLPIRTASCAVYLLLGALPIEAELHKRQLSLLYNVLTTSNETISQLTERQIIMNSDNIQSFFGRTQETLKLYDLPVLKSLRNELSSKDQWKIRTKTAVNKYWTDMLQNEAKQKSSVKYLNANFCALVMYTQYGRL